MGVWDRHSNLTTVLGPVKRLFASPIAAILVPSWRWVRDTNAVDRQDRTAEFTFGVIDGVIATIAISSGKRSPPSGRVWFAEMSSAIWPIIHVGTTLVLLPQGALGAGIALTSLRF